MSDSIEAFGALADAGLVAASLDSAGGTNHAESAHADHRCANCETPLSGHFCANCGQKAHVHRSILHVGEEFLHGITHFEGKAWTTLPMLLFHPGTLTRDYVMGKRARYIAPVPLFLLVVFTMFLAFSFLGTSPAEVGKATVDTPIIEAEARAALPEIEAELRDIDRQIAVARASGDRTATTRLAVKRAATVVVRNRIAARARNEVVNPLDLSGAIAAEVGQANGSLKFETGNQSLNAKFTKALKNPELVRYKVQNKAYKLSFLLVPLSLPWLWLMFFWKREVRMYDHAVFALYSISFMSLLFVVGSLALTMGVQAAWFWFPLVVVAPVTHMFVQLKGAYALGNGAAAWRTAALTAASIVTLGLFAALMLVIGVLD